ncbi:MAG: PEGA domain-containing protein [Vicinamibacterales bacterium]
MRLLIAAVLAAVPLAAAAQSRPSTVPSSLPPPVTPAIGLPPIGLPLAPIGLPLPDITPTLAPIGGSVRSTPTRTAPERPTGRVGHRSPRRGGRPAGVVYVVPAYGFWGAGLPPAEPPGPAAPEPVASGTLWLDIEPRGIGEIYLDGYFVGTTLDVRGSVEVDAGRHRVEVRAEGYQPIGVDVRVEAGGVVTLRRTLAPLAEPAPAAVPPPPPARKPFYYIPGCYLGDVPPAEAGLPAGCDAARTVVVHP